MYLINIYTLLPNYINGSDRKMNIIDVVTVLYSTLSFLKDHTKGTKNFFTNY